MSQDTSTEQVVGENQPSPPSLQISDIEAVVRVIDYAAEQGAFKGWGVIEEVLVLRNRLFAFVSSISPAQNQPQPQPQPQDAGGDDIPDSPAAE